MNTLTVSDIERLAKAGVTMSFDDICHQIMPDPPEVSQQDVFSHPCSLVESFWQRWRRANPSNPHSMVFVSPPYVIASATEYGDKVYVCVAPTDREPFILEDDKHLYPSDSLMAKLHLMERTK